jgi:hypothetical protein
MVTPELVYPSPAGAKVPEIHLPLPFPNDYPTSAPQNPVSNPVGGAPVPYKRDVVPIEELTTPAPAPAAAAPAAPVMISLPPVGAGATSQTPPNGQP